MDRNNTYGCQPSTSADAAGRDRMRLCGIDFLRGIAAFGIVGCHLVLGPRTAAGEWVTHFCNMNVAVFGVIAGYFTHVSDAGNAGADILKRLRRLLPTYVVWTFVFLAASFVFKVAAHDDLSQYSDISFWMNVVFCGNSSVHLWFIAVLVYAQAFALLLLRRNPPDWVKWGLGAAGIALSVALDNWWGKYFFRLFGFIWLGIAVRDIRWGSWKSFGVASLVALAAHVMLTGIVHGFFRDMLAAVPLVLFAARLPLGGGGIFRCAQFLGATSMGVYLVHPLLTKFGHEMVTRFCDKPYGVGVVLTDWVLCWGAAIGFASIALRIPYLRRVVR